jgi:hypothetical protein
MKTTQVLGIGILVLAGFVALCVGVGFLDLGLQSYFSPRQEAVRRNTFKQSNAYNEGLVQELRSMQFQYEQADHAHKAALRSIILHRVAAYDELALPNDTQYFLAQIRQETR